MTPEGALVVARAAGAVRAEKAARCDAAHLLCVSHGHRESAAALGRCRRCTQAITDTIDQPGLFSSPVEGPVTANRNERKETL